MLARSLFLNSLTYGLVGIRAFHNSLFLNRQRKWSLSSFTETQHHKFAKQSPRNIQLAVPQQDNFVEEEGDEQEYYSELVISTDENDEDEEEKDSVDFLLENVSDDDDVDEENEDFHVRFDTLMRSVENAINTNKKKIDSLSNEYIKAQSAETHLHRANLITSNLYQITPGATSITVQDWESESYEEIELVLSKEFKTFQDEADALFTTARKMKRGSTVIKPLIEENEKYKEIFKEAQDQLNSILSRYESKEEDNITNLQQEMDVLETRLMKKQKQTGFKLITPKKSHKKRTKSQNNKQAVSSPYRTFRSPNSGLKILVGRSRRSNEMISLQIARGGSDVWFHSRGVPGAHVLLQYRRGGPKITEDCIQFAANLAAFYSEARTEQKAVISMADPKHISKPRGAPLGAVKIREELGTILGNPFDVPEECVLKRMEQGGGDGTGTRGNKAKNRKFTQTIAKQAIEKKKAQRREKKNNRRGGKNYGGHGSGSETNEADWY